MPVRNLAAGQDLGNVHHVHVRASPTHQPRQVHQAGHVRRGQHFGACPCMVREAIQPHLARNRFFIDRERAPKTTAFVRPLQLRDLDPSSRSSKCRILLNVGPTNSLELAIRKPRNPWQLWWMPTL